MHSFLRSFAARPLVSACLLALATSLLPLHLSAINAPTLLTPSHNSLGYVANPNFTWSTVSDAVSYDIQISSSTTFSSLVAEGTIEITRFVPKAPLYTANRFWRVRATDANGVTSAWSSTFVYQLRAPAYTQNIPANASLTDIRSAIATAIANKPATVVFAAGATYTVNPTDAYVVSLTDAQDLIIDGNNATFIIENPKSGFIRMTNCQRVAVRRLKIDYNPLPHSVGIVEGINSTTGAITVRRLPGYPDFDAPHMIANWSWGSLLDPTHRGWLKPGVRNLFNFDKTSVTQSPTDSDVFTFNLLTASYSGEFTLNDRLIVFARANGQELCGVTSECRDITFDRITNYASPAGHYSLFDTTEIKILDCHSLKKNSTRWFAGNADGVHSRANLLGPWVEGCSFEGTGDDGIALYNKGLFVLGQDTTTWNKLTISGGALMNFKPTHIFRVFNPRDGTLVGGAFTVATVTANGANYDVTFSPALTTPLVFNQTDPTHNDQLFNVSRRNSSFVIKDNLFDGVRRYGTAVRSAGGIIRGNTYKGASKAAVVMLNEPDTWHNGLYSLNNLVTGNTTENCGFDSSASDFGDITVVFRKLGGISPTRAHSGLIIENNTIKNWSQRGISLENSAGSTIVNNTFVSTQSGFALPGQNHGIYVNNTSGTIVSGNDFTAETRSVTAAVTVTGNND